jgi:hypothetical protein
MIIFVHTNSLTCVNIMTDTPQYIKEQQLKIWLSKSPTERLKQFLEDNDALFKFWMKAKESNTIKEKTNSKP